MQLYFVIYQTYSIIQIVLTSSFFAYVWFTTLRSSIFATTYLTQAILAQYRKRSNKKNRAKTKNRNNH